MTEIGDLNRRLVLEAPAESADGEGGVARSYVTVTTLWAQVVPQPARANVAADSLGAAPRCALRSSFALAPTSPRATGFRMAPPSIASSPCARAPTAASSRSMPKYART